MKKKNILIIVSLVSIALLAISIITLVLLNNDKKEINSDALKFKEAYESLNNTVRESDGAKYNNITIPEDNPIKYINAVEASEIIKNGTGIIYFGANWCPWCRNAVPVLFEAAKQNYLDEVYYVDMDTVKNTWEVKNGKLVKTTKEKEGYYDLLSSLDSVLGKDTYSLTDKDGNKYDTKEKRIYMPFVVAIKDGEIVSSHVGTVNLNSDQTKYSLLTDSQQDELLKIYDKMIDLIRSDDTCNRDESCS